MFVSLSHVLITPGHILVLGNEGHQRSLSPVPPGIRLHTQEVPEGLSAKGAFGVLHEEDLQEQPGHSALNP